MRPVMGICMKIVNSIQGRSLQRRMFRSQLEENESDYGELLYHADVRWISRESAEGYPLPVNDIPQAREIPQNTPYHDVFMGAMPSSRRGNTSPFSVGPGAGHPRQTSHREDRHIVRNARIQPTASTAAIQAHVAPSLRAPVSS
ncbi:hypothetical protein TNCV_465171 [Trichonephila clavipes]|nr:hypothetical protein TNCV_465171 [Trichonephila clavipes]